VTPSALEELIARFGVSDGKRSCRVITRQRGAATDDPDHDLDWMTDVDSHEDLEGLARTALAIVFDQIEHMPPHAATHLLAQLRDRYADRVIVVDGNEVFAIGDYLALGFESLEEHAFAERAFVYDPDSPSRRREWNNARNWANPENFDKFRW
jgi:hypothetical protein